MRKNEIIYHSSREEISATIPIASTLERGVVCRAGVLPLTLAPRAKCWLCLTAIGLIILSLIGFLIFFYPNIQAIIQDRFSYLRFPQTKIQDRFSHPRLPQTNFGDLIRLDIQAE